jgi:hypothetical protein
VKARYGDLLSPGYYLDVTDQIQVFLVVVILLVFLLLLILIGLLLGLTSLSYVSLSFMLIICYQNFKPV